MMSSIVVLNTQKNIVKMRSSKIIIKSDVQKKWLNLVLEGNS